MLTANKNVIAYLLQPHDIFFPVCRIDSLFSYVFENFVCILNNQYDILQRNQQPIESTELNKLAQ